MPHPGRPAPRHDTRPPPIAMNARSKPRRSAAPPSGGRVLLPRHAVAASPITLHGTPVRHALAVSGRREAALYPRPVQVRLTEPAPRSVDAGRAMRPGPLLARHGGVAAHGGTATIGHTGTRVEVGGIAVTLAHVSSRRFAACACPVLDPAKWLRRAHFDAHRWEAIVASGPVQKAGSESSSQSQRDPELSSSNRTDRKDPPCTTDHRVSVCWHR